jgi:hypothetical protein
MRVARYRSKEAAMFGGNQGLHASRQSGAGERSPVFDSMRALSSSANTMSCLRHAQAGLARSMAREA